MSNYVSFVALLYYIAACGSTIGSWKSPTEGKCIIDNGRCSYYINLLHGCSDANNDYRKEFSVNEQSDQLTEIERNLAVLRVDHSRRLSDLESKIERLLMPGVSVASSQRDGIGARGKTATNEYETDSGKPLTFKDEEGRGENILLLQVHKEFSGLRRDLASSRRQTRILEAQLEDSRLKLNRTSHSLLRTASKLLETEMKLSEVMNDRDNIGALLNEAKRNLSTIKAHLDEKTRELRNTTAELHRTIKRKAQLQLELERSNVDKEKLRIRLNDSLELYNDLNKRHENLTKDYKRKEALLIECFRGKTSQFCGFEDPKICGFVQDREDDGLDWVRWKDRTPAAHTGPTIDHTCGNSKGYYMYFDASPTGRGTTAKMFSARYYSYSDQCVQFHYHMFGRHIGTLNVYTVFSAHHWPYGLGEMNKRKERWADWCEENELMVSGNEATPLWRAFGNQGDVWIMARLAIPASVATQGYQVVFEGITDRGYQGDIAVDDFQVFDGLC